MTIGLLAFGNLFAIADLPSGLSYTLTPQDTTGYLNPTLTVVVTNSNNDYTLRGISATIKGEDGWVSSLYSGAFVTSTKYQINEVLDLPSAQKYTVTLSIRWRDENAAPGDNDFTSIVEKDFTVQFAQVSVEAGEEETPTTVYSYPKDQPNALDALRKAINGFEILSITFGLFMLLIIKRRKRNAKD